MIRRYKKTRLHLWIPSFAAVGAYCLAHEYAVGSPLYIGVFCIAAAVVGAGMAIGRSVPPC